MHARQIRLDIRTFVSGCDVLHILLIGADVAHFFLLADFAVVVMPKSLHIALHF